MKLTRQQASDLWNWAPDQLTSLREEINRLFDAPFSDWTQSTELFNGWTPALDLYEDKDNLIVKAELPGMRKEEIDISLHDGTLAISGERKRQSRGGEKAERTERYVGAFRRSITLPTRVDASKVSATYKDGILKVTLPKAEEAKPKQIQVG